MARQSTWIGMRIEVALGAASVVLLALTACGNSGGTGGAGGTAATKPCNEAPFQCKAGQTCWPNTNLTAFQCLNSGPGKQGDVCQLIGGQVTCGDGLICIATTDPKMGVCTPYCDPTDPNHACPGSEVCSTFALSGGTIQLKACNPSGSTSTTTTGSTTTGSTTTSSTSSSAASTSSSASSSSSSSSSSTSTTTGAGG